MMLQPLRQLLEMTMHLFTGLFTLSSCQYHYVRDPKNWTEAQRYCREKYTDLATVSNMEDMNRLNHLTIDSGYDGAVWIGLKKGQYSRWQWSLADIDHYSKGQTQFSEFWDQNQPNNLNEDCGVMTTSGKWHDYCCTTQHFPVCYDGTKPPAGHFLMVQQLMTWREAQLYCRKHHTDLASVRNQTENKEICNVAGSNNVWIGLFKDTWTWSDQSNSSFRYWVDRQLNKSCAAWNRSTSGQWIDRECLKECPFVCYDPRPPTVKKIQVVRVRMTPDPNMDLNDAKKREAILQQIKEKMKANGMTWNLELRWKEQLDEKVFHKEEKKENDREKKREPKNKEEL
ncbi:secretory phospholipase A2 receptor-like isoform X2 [Oncorhynchus keta]|uniref:secretory phospholipase A2 receptor-like isoform X2 n=1 Tax=Oncorhynchus keta TaxID=8018 RepID=UPI00227A6A32|nr:secretory phospholipase A2 receptor-like isoform X2 [Oncorhynchus keta]